MNIRSEWLPAGSDRTSGKRCVSLASAGDPLPILCAGQLMVILDGAIVNVALPSIEGSLGSSPSSLGWVLNAYPIPFGGLLLLSGRPTTASVPPTPS